jgi:predicted O-methyltransferase YrrM
MDKEEKYKIIHEVFGTRPYWSPLPFIVRKGRDRLGELFRRLGHTTGAELGVHNGRFSLELCKAIPNLHLYCIDWWKRYGGFSQAGMDARYEESCRILEPYNTTIIRDTTFNAVNQFENGQLDFIYIDAGHSFDECSLDLILWSKKVKRGGIIALHDYHLTGDVAAAVEAYVRGHRVEMWFKTQEKYPSVFWVH